MCRNWCVCVFRNLVDFGFHLRTRQLLLSSKWSMSTVSVWLQDLAMTWKGISMILWVEKVAMVTSRIPCMLHPV